MSATNPGQDRLLEAAKALLAARGDGMLTSAEWEALERAVADADGSARPSCGAIAPERTATGPDGPTVCGRCGAALHPSST